MKVEMKIYVVISRLFPGFPGLFSVSMLENPESFEGARGARHEYTAV